MSTSYILPRTIMRKCKRRPYDRYACDLTKLAAKYVVVKFSVVGTHVFVFCICGVGVTIMKRGFHVVY